MTETEYPGYDPDDADWEECPCSSPGYPHTPNLHEPGASVAEQVSEGVSAPNGRKRERRITPQDVDEALERFAFLREATRRETEPETDQPKES